MEWESKKKLYRSETMLMKFTLPLGYLAYKKKKRRNPGNYYTVEQILSAVGLKISEQCEEIQKQAEETVSGIFRIGSRFTKNCICVQLYEDAVDLMPIAMEKGALFCVTKRPVPGVPCVVSDNPARIYADMCQLYRRDGILATAVVGSIGKTTTKKMVYSVYKTAFSTFCDVGNDNQIDGVGYISQHIPKKTDKWIQEVSEDTKGCVEQISKIIKPNIAIITAVDKSHIEQFGSEEGILDEIRSITEHMRSDGICITSMDDENTVGLIKNRKVVFISMNNSEADFYADSITVDTDGLKFDIIDKTAGKVSTMRLRNVFAVHNVYSALYAFAAGVYQGISYENIVKGIEKYKSTGVRQNIFKSKGITVYADCYNAVAKSVRSAINAASEIPIKGKRIAVLGDIAETGDYTESTHAELIDIVNNSNFDVLLALGENICKAIKDNRVRDDLTVISCENHKQLNKVLRKTMKRGDLVLFKASHSGRLDKSLRSVFPFAYVTKMLEYYWPQATWRIKVIFS